MKITYDEEAEAAYVYLTDKPIDHTEQAAPDVWVDVDSEGYAVGIELLGVTKPEFQ